jgi:hypothetical protein
MGRMVSDPWAEIRAENKGISGLAVMATMVDASRLVDPNDKLETFVQPLAENCLIDGNAHLTEPKVKEYPSTYNIANACSDDDCTTWVVAPIRRASLANHETIGGVGDIGGDWIS